MAHFVWSKRRFYFCVLELDVGTITIRDSIRREILLLNDGLTFLLVQILKISNFYDPLL